MALFFISFVLSLVPKCVFFSLALALGEGCDGCDGFDTFTHLLLAEDGWDLDWGRNLVNGFLSIDDLH